jgi:hypothetical protein
MSSERKTIIMGLTPREVMLDTFVGVSIALLAYAALAKPETSNNVSQADVKPVPSLITTIITQEKKPIPSSTETLDKKNMSFEEFAEKQKEILHDWSDYEGQEFILTLGSKNEIKSYRSFKTKNGQGYHQFSIRQDNIAINLSIRKDTPDDDPSTPLENLMEKAANNPNGTKVSLKPTTIDGVDNYKDGFWVYVINDITPPSK